MAPWADHLYACDGRWWKHHGDAARPFRGQKWICMPNDDPGDHRAMAAKYGLRAAHGEYDRSGLRTDGLITFGGNSGHQAIHLAYNLGAARILLLGYDFGGGSHWFGAHPPELDSGHDYANWLKELAQLAEGLHGAGVEVINCSRQTAITCFPRMPIEDVAVDSSHRRAGHAGRGKSAPRHRARRVG